LTINKKQEAQKRLREEKFKREHKLIDDIDHKICNKHHIFFPEEDPWLIATEEYFYHNDKNQSDFLHPCCKRCAIIKSRINQIENEERAKKTKLDWYKDHKELNWKRANEWKEKDHEYALQCYNDWLKTENGKISSKSSYEKRKSKEHQIYDIEWDNLKKYFDNKCCYCGLPIEEHWIRYRGKILLGDFHKDHAIDEGRNDIKNSLPACESCNSSKHDKTLHQFYNPKNPNYTRERYLRIVEWLKGGYKPYILPKRRYKGQRMTERLKEVEMYKSNKILKSS